MAARSYFLYNIEDFIEKVKKKENKEESKKEDLYGYSIKGR